MQFALRDNTLRYVGLFFRACGLSECIAGLL
jgi:hypothetical protein